MGFLSLRLVGVVGARNYARRSFSQWVLIMAWELNPGSVNLEPNTLKIKLSLSLSHDETSLWRSVFQINRQVFIVIPHTHLGRLTIV